LHSLGWLHKSFRSRNILLFETRDPEHEAALKIDWAQPYVVGFELSHDDKQYSAHTVSEDEREWGIRLYLHPERLQATTPPFSKMHDIYSLGVMLLEVGRLTPLTGNDAQEKWNSLTPVELRQEIVKLSGELVATMGPKYAEVVKVCLCSDFDVKNNNTEVAFGFSVQGLSEVGRDTAVNGLIFWAVLLHDN